MMRALFQVLAAHPDGLAASQAIAEVERQTPPTPFEEGEFPGSPGVRRFEKIISFSTIGPVKAGWLVKNKGQWSLTHEGQRALRRFTDPAEFTRESDGLYRVWKKVSLRGPQTTLSRPPSNPPAPSRKGPWSEINRYLLA